MHPHGLVTHCERTPSSLRRLLCRDPQPPPPCSGQPKTRLPAVPLWTGPVLQKGPGWAAQGKGAGGAPPGPRLSLLLQPPVLLRLGPQLGWHQGLLQTELGVR